MVSTDGEAEIRAAQARLVASGAVSQGRLFRPAVAVTIAGQSAINLDADGLRIAFRVRQSMTSTPDSADVTVYNFSAARRRVIETLFGETGSAKVVLRTGYDGVIKLLFAGDVREMRAQVRSPNGDTLTMVSADDGGDAIAEGLLSGGSTAGHTAEDMVDVALAAIALPPPYGTATVITKHESVGRALAGSGAKARNFFKSVQIGRARDLLDEAARIVQARWFLRDGVLHFAQRGIPTDGLSVLLPRTHWLSEPSEDGEGLVRVSTFLDPALTPGRQVALAGRVDPWSREDFRVEEMTASGDTHVSQPWRADLVLERLRIGG